MHAYKIWAECPPPMGKEYDCVTVCVRVWCSYKHTGGYTHFGLFCLNHESTAAIPVRGGDSCTFFYCAPNLFYIVVSD